MQYRNKPEYGTRHIQVRLEPQQYRRVRILCAQSGERLQAYMSRLIAEDLEKHDALTQKKEQKK